MTQINKPSEYFNTVIYTGNGSTQSINVGFQPDWSWFKSRDATTYHALVDAVRGETKFLYSNGTDAEGTYAAVDFTSTGYDLTHNANINSVNSSGSTKVAWNWRAAGTAPSKTYTVKVVSDSGNKYRFDDFGTSAVTLEISEGGTFRFDQSDSSNSGHPLRFSTTSDGTHGGGSEYTTGVTTNGTPGSAGAYTEITVAASAPTLYYYCSVHSGMGGQANTPTTNSFSNFDGSIQSNVSPNSTSLFSIVTYTGTGANATVGHGLGSTPKIVILKNRDNVTSWPVGGDAIGTTDNNYLLLNQTAALDSASTGFQSFSTTTVGLGSDTWFNGNNINYIMYCFAEKKGFSKFGSYTGNGNADGPFVYTGFKPAMIIFKNTAATEFWNIFDNKRDPFNQVDAKLYPNGINTEASSSQLDFLSNGFKLRNTEPEFNQSGSNIIYMAFAEQPLVGTNNIPATAR